jgi:hypothetical protein
MRKQATQRATVDIGPLSLRAELAPDTLNEEARTVELVFSTGAQVTRTDFWSAQPMYIEELSLEPGAVRLDRLNAGAPVLDSHSAWSIAYQLGVIVPGSGRIERAQDGRLLGRATAQFSKRATVEPLWQDIKDGVIRNVSVGYRVHKYEETAGTDGKLPTRRAVDWEPYEISMVPMGADLGAQTRSGTVPTNPCVLITRGAQEGKSMTEEQRKAKAEEERKAKAKAKAATRQEDTVDPDEDGNCPDGYEMGEDGMCHLKDDAEDDERAAATVAERERILGITRAVSAAGLPGTFAEHLIKNGASLVDARSAVIDQLATRSRQVRTDQTVRVETGEDEADKWRRGVSAWLWQKAAVDSIIRAAATKKPDHPAFKGLTFEPGEFRGMSLLDLARDSLERRGIRTRGLDKMRVAELATRAGGYQTTSDFAVALESVLGKTLLAAYTIAPDDWRRFCGVGSVSDFRAHNRYRTGFLGRLDIVREHGEFNNKAVPDAVKESITAETRGNIIALSRQAIVNDDMGVFNRVAAQIGRAAALSIELDVFDLLKLNAGLGPLMNDGNTLFHATHDNIGAGSALAVAGLDADRVVMAEQTDPSGNEVLNLRPAILVLAVGLGGEARVLNQAQYEPIDNKFQKPNKVVGLFRDVVDSPQLTGTRRYLFADPALMPVIEVAFLEGQQEPFMETQDGWRVDGVEWKVRLDYGVAAIEFRGAVTNAGA